MKILLFSLFPIVGISFATGCSKGVDDIIECEFGAPLRLPIESFKMDMGRYPTEEEGLAILFLESATPDGKVMGPYLDNTDYAKEFVRSIRYTTTEAGGYRLEYLRTSETYHFEPGDAGNGGNALEE